MLYISGGEWNNNGIPKIEFLKKSEWISLEVIDVVNKLPVNCGVLISESHSPGI